jgi:sec-independent protein translocase protein TatA
MPGPTEWIIIGVVILLLFGAKKLPEMARALGRSSNEFKKGLKEGADEDARSESEEPEKHETKSE